MINYNIVEYYYPYIVRNKLIILMIYKDMISNNMNEKILYTYENLSFNESEGIIKMYEKFNERLFKIKKIRNMNVCD